MVRERYKPAAPDRATLARGILTLLGLGCVLVLIVLFGRLFPGAMLLAAPLVAVPLLAHAAMPVAYALDERTLYVERRLFRTVRLPLASLTEVSPLPRAALAGAIRVYGTGGLFGWAGRYRVRGLGSVSMCATNLERLVLIQRRHRRPLLISPADPQAFFRGLRRQYETIVIPPRR